MTSVNRHGERCSDACGEGRHAECTETFETCNCTYRGLHVTSHRYATVPVAPAPTASAREFFKTYPHCVGYPDCDGDLEGEEHSELCQLTGKEEFDAFKFAEAYASSQSEKLAGVGQQAAEEIVKHAANAITYSRSDIVEDFAAIIDRVIAGRVK